MDYHPFLAEFARTYLGRGLPDRREIALTFDDGPGGATPALLGTLRALDIQATFFCLGETALRAPETIQAIVREGHELGSHGYGHEDSAAWAPETFRDAQVLPAARVLDSLAGSKIPLFRPPYGEIAAAQVDVLATLGYTLVGWSIDPRDWADDRSDDHVRRVVDAVAGAAHPGAIVLLHDGDDEHGVTRQHIATIVEQLVPVLRDQGFAFVTVGELLARRDGARPASR